MLIEVKVPQLSESVAEATLQKWHKQAGEFVRRDENLVDIETDKVVLETPAPESGVIVKIVKGEGGTVVSNEVIAQIDTKGAATTSAAAPKQKDKSPVEAPAAKAGISAMPAAQRLAAEKNVDPAGIPGTGRGGRVTKEDVIRAVEGGAQPAGRAAAPVPQRVPAPAVDSGAPGERSEQRVPMSRLRARIAERLVQSQHTAAMLTTFNEVNMQPVIELRRKYQERFEKEHGVKLGFMSFFVKAVVHALKKYPVVNASIDGTDIVYHGYYDIGIAVGSPRGLVVPIVRNADQLALAEIEGHRRLRQARAGRQAHDGGADRRHVFDFEWGRIRLHAVHPDHQPAAERDPRRARHARPAGGRERTGGDPAGQLPGAVVRPPYHRWARSRADAGRHQGRARGSGAHTAGYLKK